MNLIVRDMDTPEHCTTPQDEVPQSLAFTVTFGEAKKKNFKRHSRNLSLPVVKVYENNVSAFIFRFCKSADLRENLETLQHVSITRKL